MDYSLSQMCDQVMTARANFRPIEIVGGGTKRFYGNPSLADESPVQLQMSALSGVVHYEPSELVLTAMAGTPLSEVRQILAQQGQMLPFDPPSFGCHTTIGGAVAAGLSGPLSFGYGPLRHYVLGVHLLDAQGRILKFGGEVMKNVAGYDVSRLLAGSLGMFGAIVQVSLKVLPRPIMDLSLSLTLSHQEALTFCEGLRARAWPIKAAAWLPPGQLVLRLCGAQSAVKQACQVIGGVVLAETAAESWWSAFRDQKDDFFACRPLWRLAVRANTREIEMGPMAFDLGGEVRWLCGDFPAARVRETAERAGGHATLFRWHEGYRIPGDGVFHPLAPAIHAIVRRLKQELDPKSIFNPGRLVAGI